MQSTGDIRRRNHNHKLQSRELLDRDSQAQTNTATYTHKTLTHSQLTRTSARRTFSAFGLFGLKKPFASHHSYHADSTATMRNENHAHAHSVSYTPQRNTTAVNTNTRTRRIKQTHHHTSLYNVTALITPQALSSRAHASHTHTRARYGARCTSARTWRVVRGRHWLAHVLLVALWCDVDKLRFQSDLFLLRRFRRTRRSLHCTLRFLHIAQSHCTRACCTRTRRCHRARTARDAASAADGDRSTTAAAHTVHTRTQSELRPKQAHMSPQDVVHVMVGEWRIASRNE